MDYHQQRLPEPFKVCSNVPQRFGNADSFFGRGGVVGRLSEASAVLGLVGVLFESFVWMCNAASSSLSLSASSIASFFGCAGFALLCPWGCLRLFKRSLALALSHRTNRRLCASCPKDGDSLD